VAEAPSPTEVAVPPRVSQGPIPATAERRDIPKVRDGRVRAATLQSSDEPSAFATVYILEFGRFSNLSAARARAQQVRSKGYAAQVAGGAALYRVIGREFRSQASAERWKGILEEIGLESRVSQQVVAQRTITVTKFAVDFGEFTQRTAAETLARIVRSRGYLVKVASTGPGFQVLGRGHMDKTRAESWANLFREIGFEASVTSIRELTQYPVN
ncbi:MAG TPA: SPOR domain-containing protein, partial [bacterium]|nr:SPOR domain-containing protein [bacterium]